MQGGTVTTEGGSKKKAFTQGCGLRNPEDYERIPGHQYSGFVVRYALSLRCETNSSPRDISKAIKRLADFTFGLVDKIPSRNTIEDWIRKCGLDEVRQTPDALKDIDYAVIFDECMMIGSEKLLPVLAVPAEHQGHPLRPEDVKVISLNVKSGWDAKAIKNTLNESATTVGKDPEYAITDNDSKMRKAVRLTGLSWHRDISHTLAMFMERVYKDDPDFVDFNKCIATSKMQYCMKDIAYLQSPSQRTKARFMNLSESVSWALDMSKIYHDLPANVKVAYSFIPKYVSLSEELNEMVSAIHFIETEMKQHGLSHETNSKCRSHVCKTIMPGNDRMRRVGFQILEYLENEDLMLKGNVALNNSSDIIESMFGIFKYMQSPNKMNGVTTLVLNMPVRLAFAGESAAKNYNVKERLTRTKIKDIIQWGEENLLDSLVVKRINTLKTA